MEAMNGVVPVYNLADNNHCGCGCGGYGNGYNNGFGFGGDWAWILVFFVLFGWGNNGWGGNGYNNAVTSDYLLNQTSRLSEQILTQANATNQGICDATYSLNNSIKDSSYNSLDAIRGLSAQVAQCCCDNRFDMSQGFCGVNRNIDNLRYEMAEKFCKVYNDQARDTAAILQAIHNTSCEEQIRDLTRRNAELSQTSQTATILASVQNLLKEYNPTTPASV